MKPPMLLLAVTGLALTSANKVVHNKPKTAFCMTGNVRANHKEHQSKELRKRLDMIDPNGIVFAYVNPCEAQTEPWWWGMVHKGKKKFVPQKPKGDCWGGSFWRKTLRPKVVKEYRDQDVAPVPRPCKAGSPSFIPGVYQQWKGVQECFKLIQEYEEKNSFKFETVARFRADACHDQGGCDQVTYCSVDKLDRHKVYLHKHGINGGVPNYFDNFAILSRQYADVYFNALDVYFKECTVGGAGEALLNRQMWLHKVPTDDKCECHPFCAPPGKSIFIERHFMSDLESYRDIPIFMETVTQPNINFFNAPSKNATSSEFVQPTYMRLQLSPSA